jgi:hypothetical protein
MRKPNPFSVLSSIRKSFSDSFNRADNEEGLGLADDGRKWDLIRGFFRILNNKAFSPSEPENYPIATINMPYQDVEINVNDFKNGSGLALWVTDSGNWWGLGLEQEEVPCNCSVSTDCNRWNQGGLCQGWNVGNCNRWNSSNCREEACSSWNANSCTGWNSSNCASSSFVFFCRTFACSAWSSRCLAWWNIGVPPRTVCAIWSTPTCTRWTCSSGGEREVCNSWNSRNCRSWSGSNCSGNACVRWNSRNCNRWNTQNCNTWSTESCNRWFEFTFDCQTCYPQWIRIIQSANSTITTVARFLITKTFRSEPSPRGGLTLFFQNSFINKIIQSIKVFTSGNQIKADLFYDSQFQDKVDVEEDIIYTATGAEVTPAYGILVIPSEYEQNKFVGFINIDKN